MLRKEVARKQSLNLDNALKKKKKRTLPFSPLPQGSPKHPYVRERLSAVGTTRVVLPGRGERTGKE